MMVQSLVFIVLQVALIASGKEVPDYVPGLPEISPFARSLPTCPPGKIGQYCGDCRTLLLCLGDTLPSDVVKCDDSRPYCVDERCSETPRNPHDHTCDVNNQYFCPSEGYIPDPNNCSKYYFCDAPQGSAIIYNCPDGYSYDAKAPSAQKPCKRRRTEADCATINCSRGKDFEVYPADRSFYGYCNRITGETKVLRCGDEIYERFDPEVKSCVVTCPAEGRFPDRRHCHQYYECYYDQDNLLVPVSQTCPLGMSFNPETSDCEHPDSACKSEIS